MHLLGANPKRLLAFETFTESDEGSLPERKNVTNYKDKSSGSPVTEKSPDLHGRDSPKKIAKIF